ncbi:MAG: hypothetical protein KME52_03590 [Desmonostoc geniculatum HA4340-LM1]|nr:hypothetical protein [Desmonostoc geniculatum HA4340-LM1]
MPCCTSIFAQCLALSSQKVKADDFISWYLTFHGYDLHTSDRLFYLTQVSVRSLFGYEVETSDRRNFSLYLRSIATTVLV